tara:strand:+ start:3955 stop:4869 length:915 start_codon:yes stop_codon:yes gene_type:complete
MRKKKIFLHIGNHKTATTSVQHFFSKKKKYLIKKNFLYAVGGGIDYNNNNVSWEAINHFYFSKNRQNIKDLLSIIKKNSKMDILISSENLENLKYNSKFKKFILEIKKSHKIKIIWTIREQFSYLMSLLTTLMNKGAFVNNFDNLVTKIKKGKLSFPPYIFWFNYYLQYKKICKIYNVSKKDINLIVYYKNINIFKEFLKILKINLKTKKNEITKNKSNELFQNKLNIKNYLKNFLKISDKKFNKNLTKSKNLFLIINKKNKLQYRKNDFTEIKQILISHFKRKNDNLFKEFNIEKKKIKEFYE